MIYKPKNNSPAEEYSPFGVRNPYLNCDHKCKYCYMLRFQPDFHKKLTTPRPNFLKELELSAQKHKFGEQVFMSFSGDPYVKLEKELRLTRKALEILYKYRIPVVILTKGGTLCLYDLDIMKKFGKHIKVGATIIFSEEEHREKFEPGASPLIDRYNMLRRLKKEGITTWLSIEPIINIQSAIKIIEDTVGFVDEYMFGCISGLEDKNKLKDYRLLGDSILFDIAIPNNHGLYIKKSLQKYIGIESGDEENVYINAKYLNLQKFSNKQDSLLREVL